ncbi:MAG: hypothetical protein NTU88_01435 [Armatimonadetes bacterium]|nr:hypothetical protein [Armatimonadota bacterium]
MRVEFPKDWHVKPVESSEAEMVYQVFADQPADSNTLLVSLNMDGKAHETSFIILGPNAGKDWQPASGVPTCPKCHARTEACLCPK